ncbi:contractile injection system protein, VgrG/Pvc8 family, partial [Pseudoxanthomonas putridarboris]
MPTQSDYRFDFEIPEGPSFEVVRFGLSEGLSTPFRLELELASGESSMDFDALLDVAATFTLSRGGVAVRQVHGIVTAFEQGASG